MSGYDDVNYGFPEVLQIFSETPCICHIFAHSKCNTVRQYVFKVCDNASFMSVTLGLHALSTRH